MKDKEKLSADNKSKLSNVEQQANYEGLWTLVLFERLGNEEIRDQITNLLHQGQKSIEKFYKETKFEFCFEQESGEKIYKDPAGRQYSESEIKGFKAKTREEIEESLLVRLKEVSQSTPISFGDEEPSEDIMHINWFDPHTGENLTLRQKSLVEAHEKGHVVRPYHGEFFDKYFAPGFDKSKVVFSEEQISALRKAMIRDKAEVEIFSDEEVIKEHLKYLFSAVELAERMSQLKNYFGIGSSDKFTKDHLDYARERTI